MSELTSYKKKYVNIRKNGEFQFLFKKGESFVTYAFICYFKKSKRRVNRIGIIASKKIGNAVIRNRARRVIRESFRQLEPLLREDIDNRFDFVFIARGRTPELKSTQIYNLMKKQLLLKLKG